MSDEATNPVADEPIEGSEAQGVADEANAQGDDQSQLDENGDPVEEQPDDSEEIEHEGAKYKVPKALKDAFLRQADYTRKTQEIAETKRALEARNSEIAQQAEARQATFEKRVQLAQVDAALEQYANLNWSDYAETYGERAAIAAQAQWRQLENAKSQLHNEINETEQAHRLSGERAVATAIQEADQILSREVEGYGPELVRNVAMVAQSIGFTPEELRESFVGADGKADTRSFKVLARLHAAETKLAALQAKQTTARQIEKQQAVQPAKTVGAKTSGYKPGLNDDLPPDEWMRRRNAQLAKR